MSPALTPKNLLVTGGCGFIGSNFINYVFDRLPGCNIINVDKLILNSNAHYVEERVRESCRYQLILTDVGNQTVIAKVLSENNVDAVVHFASDCTSTRCYSEPREAIENNVLATLSFLEAVLQYHRANGAIVKFIHISTDEVYGDSEMDDKARGKAEDEELTPGNPYAATKVVILNSTCESYVNLYRKQFGLPIVALRINNIYGPNQWDVKLVPRFIEVAKAKGKFPVQGSGNQLRSWLFVDDASEGIVAAIDRGVVGEVYNLGTYVEKSGEPISSGPVEWNQPPFHDFSS